MRKLILRFCPNLGKTYFTIMVIIIVFTLMTVQAFAVEDTLMTSS